jgi:hypothetical protein
MEKGKIIYLNGVTSTGKMSIARVIQDTADDFFYLNVIYSAAIAGNFNLMNRIKLLIKLFHLILLQILLNIHQKIVQ